MQEFSLTVRRETGEEQSVKVRYDEGVANHVDPEPCVCVREGVGEASAGARIGQPSSNVVLTERHEALIEAQAPSGDRPIVAGRAEPGSC